MFREQFADDGLHLFGESERYAFVQQGGERFGAFGHVVEKAEVGSTPNLQGANVVA